MEGEVKSLLNEAGGHRWQRIPPTEKRGRVHTSTVTVAVLELNKKEEFKINERDIAIFITKDSGPGGQHRNKTESCVVMRHIPTGLEAKAATKSQHRNRELAREILTSRVRASFLSKVQDKEAAKRKKQVGSGMRGDKIRTYRSQDNIVTDHRSGKKICLTKVISGNLLQLFYGE